MTLTNNIIEEYGMENMITRYTTLYQEMTDFIVKAGLEKRVAINCDLLCSTIISYYEDVSKYKEFFRINYLEELKIISHISYFFLYHKPLVICDDNLTQTKTINEKFVLLLLLCYINKQLGNIHILLQTDIDTKIFCEKLFQMLVAGLENVHSLELVIESFIYSKI